MQEYGNCMGHKEDYPDKTGRECMKPIWPSGHVMRLPCGSMLAEWHWLGAMRPSFKPHEGCLSSYLLFFARGSIVFHELTHGILPERGDTILTYF